jgi:TonB-linked SusC/RagA family outer membrane protein
MEGKLSGVQITSSSGSPGAASRIVIRGNSSITGNNQPLIILDGMPINNSGGGGGVFTGAGPSRLSDIDPSIIKSINVLKSAAATALYGQRAANGAIIITTKGGSYNESFTVNLNSSVGVGTPIIAGYQHEYLQGSHGKYANGEPIGKGGYTAPGYPGNNPQTFKSWGPKKGEVSQQVLNDLGVNRIKTYDPRKQFFQNSLKRHNSISFSGGSSTTSYQVNFSRMSNDGVIPTSYHHRNSVMAKFRHKLSYRLTISSMANYIHAQNKRFPVGDGVFDFLTDLQNTAISYNIRNYKHNNGKQRFQADNGNNPFWLINNNAILNKTNRFIGNVNIHYDIMPSLTIKEQVGIDTYNSLHESYYNKGVIGREQGNLSENKPLHSELNSKLTLRYKNNITDALSLNILLGNNIDSRHNSTIGFSGTGIGKEGFYDISNLSTQNGNSNISDHRLLSVYGQVKLGYNDYAYITVTGRNDWSSTLPKNNNSYFYPSISGDFIFTQLLNNNQSFLSFGKVRASFAKVGNDAPAYAIHNNYVHASPQDPWRGEIDYPFNGVNAYEVSGSLGNASLKPEITTAYEIGAKLKFVDNRISLDATYYHRKADNQIYTVSIPDATGYGGQLKNAGSITNRGWEIAIGFTPVRSKNFSWDINIHYTRNRTIVNSLAPGVNSISIGGFTAPRIAVLPGERGYGVIQAQYYERNDNGQVLVNNDGYPIFKNNVQNVGRVTPKFTGNLSTTFKFKNLSLGAIFDTKQGNDVLNFNYFESVLYGTAKITEDRGTKFVYPGVNVNTGEPNTKSIVKDQDYYVKYFRPAYGAYVEDGSYVKLRQVSLSYSLPAKLLSKTPLKGIILTATGRNLWIGTSFDWGDPEGNVLGNSNAQGFYYQQVPSTRSYNFSVNIKF